MSAILSYEVQIGDTDYPVAYNGLLAFLDPYVDEIQAGREGQASLAANFARYVRAAQGLTQNFPANGYRITGLPAPAANSDPATKLYADSLAFAAALPNQTGQDGKVTRTVAGVAGWDDWWGPATALTAAGNLAARTTYHADTTGGAFSVSLPAAAVGVWVLLRDVGRQCSTNKLTLVPDGADLVYGSAQNYEMDVSGETVLLVVDATKGWVRG